MGIIEDLRAAGITVVLQFVDVESRGRISDVRGITFAPSRTPFNARDEVIDMYADTGEFVGVIDRQGRLALFSLGPLPPKTPDHPNRRLDVDILVLTPTVDDATTQQRATVATVRQVLRAAYDAATGGG